MKYFVKHILSIVFLLVAIPLFSQTEAELKKRKTEAEKEIANLDKKLTETKKEKQSKTAYITDLNKRIAQRKKLINDTDIQISITENEIQQKNKKVSEIKSQLNRLKDSYSELLVNIYMNRKKATWLMYVFASDDLSQAYRRLKYLQSYADVVFVQAAKIEQTTKQVSDEMSLLASKKQELDIYKSERKSDIEKLEKDELAAKKILEGLKKDETALKKQIEQKRTALANLDKKLTSIIKKEVSKDKVTGNTKTPENVKLSADFSANRGRLPWPVKQGNIVGFFGKHSHHIFKNLELPENNGIDISTVAGEDVLSTFDGVVTIVFPMAGLRICVLLKHGEYFSLYGRLAIATVKIGDNVKTGTVLGKVVDDKDDSQLHFELWKGETKLNPQQWLLKK
ncbi:MAG: peptidoglycan DD-metalloendopeptidase family protein [Prevotellaceae bacterium]|jgi:septal ring factor EnvC (AmiA/AmiB activator)|nr:peptidoglycan DD-metalloendopeptidase family protein [Prevotellaceae bacterium]